MDFYGPFDSLRLMWAFAVYREFDDKVHYWEKRLDNKFYFKLIQEF